MSTQFHKDWFRLSKVNRGDTQTHRHGQQRDLISLFYFFKIRQLGQKHITDSMKENSYPEAQIIITFHKYFSLLGCDVVYIWRSSQIFHRILSTIIPWRRRQQFLRKLATNTRLHCVRCQGTVTDRCENLKSHNKLPASYAHSFKYF
jgi:hypothetical protein